MRNLLVVIFLLLSTWNWGQSIWTNPITGVDPGLTSPYTSGQTVNSNITVSGISRGSGITGNAAIDRYNANSWNTATIDLNAYFEFTLTPVAGCEIDFTSFFYVAQTSGTGPTSFAFRSSIDGYTSNIGTPNGTGTTISLSAGSYQNVTTAITFRFYAWGASSATGTYSINEFTFNGVTSCGTVNTITTGTVSTSPFNVTCLTGASGSVSFTSTGTFNPGNIFTAQLSNSSGTFAVPFSIGSLDSTSSVGINPTGTINFTIPAEMISGSGYEIRIISSNPSITGTESAAFTISLSGGPCTAIPPHITSAIINSCNPTCTEGYNEVVFGNTGDYSVLVNTTNFDISYGSTYPLVNYTDVLTTNATTTSQINAAAGCAGTFVDGTGLTLPPNSSFILAPTQICEEALQWSGLCGSGPIYIIYHNDPSWNFTGTFKNGNTGGIRYFNSTITTTGGQTFSIDYNYNSTLLQTGTAGDGDFVTFGPNGGSAGYGDNNCILSPILLPTGLIGFSGEHIHNGVLLTWKTASESNNDYFTFQHSPDGITFEEIGILKGAGSTDVEQHYSFVHDRPSKGINYYKLSSTDYDGTIHDKGIISVFTQVNGIVFDLQTQRILFGEASDYDVFSVEGKLILSIRDSSTVHFDHSGIIIISNRLTGISQRLFIPQIK
jgi:hypothetical protein